MKQILIDGVITLRKEVAEKAFQYYSVVDFEPTNKIIPIMRKVVAIQMGGVDNYA